MRTATARSPRPAATRLPWGLIRRRAVGAPKVTVRLDPLPEPAWAQWRDVSVPGPAGSSLRVAAVVLGPTGVYVVTRQESSDLFGFALRTRMASEAAQAVRSALPGRYRGAVSAMLMLETRDAQDAHHDAHHDGVLVDEVIVATSPALVEAVRARPRVLSRSEAGAISSVLAHILRPQCPGTRRRAMLWGRFSRVGRTAGHTSGRATGIAA